MRLLTILLTMMTLCMLSLPIMTVAAADEITERAVPIQELQIQPAPAIPGIVRGAPGAANASDLLDQRISLLQQQVQALTTQIAALQSVLKVTPAGVTLQAPTVTILSGQDITVQSQRHVSFRVGQNLSMDTGSNLTMKTSAATTIQSAGTMDLKGSVTRLNGGTKPLATLGSQVQTIPGQPIGQVITGSPTILGN